MDEEKKIAMNGMADAQEQPAFDVGADVGANESRNPRGKKIVEYLDEALEMKNNLDKMKCLNRRKSLFINGRP